MLIYVQKNNFGRTGQNYSLEPHNEFNVPKKLLYLRDIIPELIFFISCLDKLINYLHFGMLDRPSC